MAWFKADDRLPDNRKTRRAIDKSIAPMGLWVLAGTWSAGALTDGFVPKAVVRRWDPRLQFAKVLVTAGMWVPDEHDGEEGYQFVNWEEYQPTKKEVEAERAAARERMKKRRAARKGISPDDDDADEVQANVPRNAEVTDGARSGVVRQPRPNPTQPDPTHPLSTYVEGGSHIGERASSPPPPKCPKHVDVDRPPNCGACADTRRRREAWDADQARRAAAARSEQARAAAAARSAAIAACGLCDAEGYAGGRVCDHDPDTDDRARRGIAAVREALTKSEPAPGDPA